MSKLYKNTDYIYLLCGRATSLLGTMMQEFCLSLYVLKVTGSALQFSLVLALSAIPQVIVSPFAGVIADWFDRKRVLVILDSVSGLITLSFVIMFYTFGTIPIIGIYVLIFVLSSLAAAFQPAMTAVIPTIVSRDDYVNASSVNATVSTVCEILAPGLAGALFGILGILVVMIINAISFFVSAFFEFIMNIPKVRSGSQKINVSLFFNELGEGFKYVKANRIMLSIIILCFTVNFSCTSLSVGGAYIIKDIFKASDALYGLANTIVSVSALIAPPIALLLGNRVKFGKLVVGSCSLFTACTILSAAFSSPIFVSNEAFSLAPFIGLIAVTFLCQGAAVILSIIISSMMQTICPKEKMGRVASLLNVGAYASLPLGELVFGVLFGTLSAWLTLLIGAGIFLLVTVFLSKTFLSGNKEKAAL